MSGDLVTSMGTGISLAITDGVKPASGARAAPGPGPISVWQRFAFTTPAGTTLGNLLPGGSLMTQMVGGVVHPVALMGNITDWPNGTLYQPVVPISSVPLESRQWIDAVAVRAQRLERAAALAGMPVTVPPPGAKAFFRVVRTRIDSDLDSLWDDEERVAGTNSFLTDSNYDGTTDAQEEGKRNLVDSEKDGLVDDEDAVPWKEQLHFKRVPESRDALLPRRACAYSISRPLPPDRFYCLRTGCHLP